jgi:putative membrane protein
MLGGIWFMPWRSNAQNAGSDRLDIGSKLMLTSADTAFAIRAAQNDLAQIRLGKLAAAKASDADVRTLGKQMVDDHVKASDQLRAAAEQINMTLPDVVSVKDQATYDRLTKLSGSAFDKTFIELMLKDHEGELKASRREAITGKDPNIRDFASQMVLTLQEHLDRIRMIQSKLGISR